MTTAPNSDAAARQDQLRGGRLREQDEAELAGLAQQQSEPEAAGPAAAERAAENRDQDRLGDDDAGGEADHEQRPRGDQPQVEQHSDREEEQAEQDRAERLDVAFELVPVGRFGQHHAGDERAERHRQVKRVHHRRRADDREQAGDDEQLALAEAADQPEQRIEDEAADAGPGR